MGKRTSHLLPWRRNPILLFGAITALLLAGLATAASQGGAKAEGEGGGTNPDVTVIYLHNTDNYGSTGGVRGYSVGTVSCNIGTDPLWWCDNNQAFCDDSQHPVIAQNMYRLKDGRFTQIGMSWLKHGFFSTNSFDSACGNCTQPPHGGEQLGVGCTDAYGAGLNGSRPLGLRSEVNAATGAFPFPETAIGFSGPADQRMRVAEDDLDASLNPGALYWVEGHYIAADDAEAKNGLNNASYRPVTVEAGSFDLDLQATTVRELPAIAAWQAVDAEVELINVDNNSTSPPERFHVARKVTENKGGWHYEYAVHNMNADRSAGSFSIQLPPGSTITNAGFHNVPHHSGEPYDVDDWAVSIDEVAGTISWSTEDFATNEDANALRWGTMFSFWFDSSAGPAEHPHQIGLFKPGSPAALDFAFVDTEIFGDGFESGDTSSWTDQAP